MNFFKAFFAALLGFFVGVALLLLVFILWIGALVASADKKDVSVASTSVLSLRLDRPIGERSVNDPFGKFNPDPLAETGSTLGLNDILLAIDKAKTDDRIKGIYLHTEFFGGGTAAAESIHDALIDFKKSGKFIYAYGEFYTERAYALAATADSIYLYPNGGMEWNGVSANPFFVRGLLEKVGVEPMVFKVGTFKSATEMFTEKKMSDPARQQTQELIGDLWGHLLTKIAAARKRDAAELNQLATKRMLMSPEEALGDKFVDALSYEDQVIGAINRKLGRDEGKKLPLVSPDDYATAVRDADDGSANVIAVVYGSGDIAGGESDVNSIGSKTLSEAIRKARQDKDVKAIVFRIDSPGGSALASDVIWREVELAKKEKPVIASFGDVAASGGYYIAAGADAIVAQPTTITGSIGIFGMLLNTQKLFNDKLGITFDRVTTNPNADIGNPNRPMNEIERRKIQSMIEMGYGDFIRVVQGGRKFADSVSVDKIAQGRVWSGIRAKQIGLVDSLGGIDVAIKLAASKAGLGDEYMIKEYPRVKTAFERLTEDFMSTAAQAYQAYTLTPEQRVLLRLRRLYDDRSPIYARAYDLNIE